MLSLLGSDLYRATAHAPWVHRESTESWFTALFWTLFLYRLCMSHQAFLTSANPKPRRTPLAPAACSCQILVDQVLVACFHPRHAFHGLEEDDVLNYEKRSPHPTINLLRCALVGNQGPAYGEKAA